MAHILIAYASRNGSTAEIAQAIGKELHAACHAADVAETGTVASPAGYDAVVIGGPMYMGQIVGDIGKFVKRFREDLAKVPVAGFIVGLAAVSKDPAGIAMAEKALHASLALLKPVAEMIFAGQAQPGKALVVHEVDDKESEITGRRLPRLGSDRCLGPGPAREDGDLKESAPRLQIA